MSLLKIIITTYAVRVQSCLPDLPSMPPVCQIKTQRPDTKFGRHMYLLIKIKLIKIMHFAIEYRIWSIRVHVLSGLL